MLSNLPLMEIYFSNVWINCPNTSLNYPINRFFDCFPCLIIISLKGIVKKLLLQRLGKTYEKNERASFAMEFGRVA